MRILLGVLAADSGHISVDGTPIAPRHRSAIGYMPEERGLYPKMKVLEQIAYLARLHGFDKREATEKATEILSSSAK